MTSCPSSSSLATWMTCTQCSGSHGLAASEAPWGQDLPLTTATPFVRGLLLKKTEQPGPPQCHGEVGHSSSSLAGQRRGQAAGCTEANQHLGLHVSALEPPPSSRGTFGAQCAGTCGVQCVAPPFSLSLCAAMFLCCQIGPLGPFQFCMGEGQGSCCPMPWAPSLGTVDTKCLL